MLLVAHLFTVRLGLTRLAHYMYKIGSLKGPTWGLSDRSRHKTTMRNCRRQNLSIQEVPVGL